MCGLAGIFAYKDSAPDVDRAELLRIRDHMTARGPDGAGVWYADNGRIGLAHRRLSIIDLSERGAQPMRSADRRYVITFNGEIYNYRALRAEIESRGRVFHSESDTEVLLHLYAEKGAAMLQDLRGMFAFAIWDDASGQLFLARDPYGIKPLYYADDGATLRIASQVKALQAGGAISGKQDPAGLAGFLLLGSVPEPFTVLRAVRALPAGSWLMADGAGPASRRAIFPSRRPGEMPLDPTTHWMMTQAPRPSAPPCAIPWLTTRWRTCPWAPSCPQASTRAPWWGS